MPTKKEEKEEVVKIKTSSKPLAPTNAVAPAPRKKVVDMKPVATSSQASSDAFLKKLRANAHEPLPKPVLKKKQSAWNVALTAVIGLALVASVGAGVYYFVVMPKGDGGSGTPEAPLAVGDELSVSVASAEVSMGAPVAISYDLSNKTGKAQLYLVDASNTLIGRIGEVPAGTTSFKWNPQDVRSEDETTSEAPTPGSYRILLAMRPEGDARPATELDERVVSAPFELAYDTLEPTGEIAFETCLNVSGYSNESWYGGLQTAAATQGISLDSVTVSCYSPAGGVLVFLASGEGIFNYPLIARFNTEDGLLREAVYTGVRGEELPGNPATFGRRDGTTIPIIVNGAITFTYDFVQNTVEDIE